MLLRSSAPANTRVHTGGPTGCRNAQPRAASQHLACQCPNTCIAHTRPEQLDLANDLLTILGAVDYFASDGTGCRNHGELDGLPEAKQLFADFMSVAPSEVIWIVPKYSNPTGTTPTRIIT